MVAQHLQPAERTAAGCNPRGSLCAAFIGRNGVGRPRDPAGGACQRAQGGVGAAVIAVNYVGPIAYFARGRLPRE